MQLGQLLSAAARKKKLKALSAAVTVGSQPMRRGIAFDRREDLDLRFGYPWAERIFGLLRRVSLFIG